MRICGHIVYLFRFSGSLLQRYDQLAMEHHAAAELHPDDAVRHRDGYMRVKLRARVNARHRSSAAAPSAITAQVDFRFSGSQNPSSPYDHATDVGRRALSKKELLTELFFDGIASVRKLFRLSPHDDNYHYSPPPFYCQKLMIIVKILAFT